MSDTTFRAGFVAPAGAPILTTLRAGVRRGQRIAADVAEMVHTYSLIEGSCLLAAMVFASMVIAAGFGVPV